MARPKMPAAPKNRSERIRRTVLVIVSCLVGAYLLACTIAYFLQRHMLFPAPRQVRNPSVAAGDTITVEGGPVILYQKPTGKSPVLVYFHGNGEQLADLEWVSSSMTRMGVGFAAIEYPGYGLAAQSGAPSETSIFDAAERGIRYLLEYEGLTKEQLVIGGHSLGTGVAMAMAERGYGVRVLLLAPFTSIPDVGLEVFPILPLRFLLKDHFDSLSRAKSVHVPVLVVHGTDDELIPIAQGKRLAAQLEHGRFVPIAYGRHNGVWSHPDVTIQMLSFIRAWEPKMNGS